MIRIDALSKRYRGGVQALDAVTLEIPVGLYGLLGPNGAGKSSLMRILATILAPDSGRFEVFGVDGVRSPGDIRQMLGYLPQEFGAYPTLSVTEYLDYMAILSGLRDGALRRRRVESILEMVRLTEKRDARTRALSGGMRRRLGIAQALLGEPRLLIVDEPTVGLDPEERVHLRNLLADLAKDRVVLLSTHIVEDVAQMAPALAVLRKGAVLFAGPVANLIRQADGLVWTGLADDRTAATLRTRGALVGAVRTAEGHQVRVLASEPPLVGARPATPTLEDAYVALMGGVLA